MKVMPTVLYYFLFASKKYILRLMQKKRSLCALTNFLDQFGDKWSLLIMRDLFLYKSREYGDFLPLSVGESPSTNILATRLKHLVDLGYVSKKKHPRDGKKYIYTLTNKGKSLRPVLQTIIDWGGEHINGTYTKTLRS